MTYTTTLPPRYWLEQYLFLLFFKLHSFRVSLPPTWIVCLLKIESENFLISVIYIPVPANKATWIFFCLGMYSVCHHILHGFFFLIAVTILLFKLELRTALHVFQFFTFCHNPLGVLGTRDSCVYFEDEGKTINGVQRKKILVLCLGILLVSHTCNKLDYIWFVLGSTSQHHTRVLADGLGTGSYCYCHGNTGTRRRKGK